MRGSVGECCDSSQIHELIPHKQPISTFSHHTIDILETGHSLDAAPAELTLYLFVDIVGEVVFNELNALEESATEGKGVGLRRRDVEVWFGDRGFGNRLEEHALEGDFCLLFGFRCHMMTR